VPEEQDTVALQSISVTSTHLLDGLKSPENRSVWQQFTDRYRPMVFKFGRKVGLRPENAEDAAQETLLAFCRAYQEGRYDRERGRLRSWLFGIARRQIKHALGEQFGPAVQIADQPDRTGFFEGLPAEDRWEGLWEGEWRQAVLRQCLEEVRQRLAPKTVEAFELFAWKEWPAKRVAAHLGMTENAVYLAKFKVLKRIQDLAPRMDEVF
jgi:RNA polymerase sigma-70 factor (ECF subfamily)